MTEAPLDASPRESAHVESTREQLLLAAEACFARYGILKTTMVDIAKATGVSRPTVYRYFDDRDSIILAVVVRRSRLLVRHARAYIDARPTFPEKVVEGLIYLVDHGRQDEIVRLLVTPEHMELATAIVGASKAAADVTAELWDPIFAEAQERGEMPADIKRADACAWLTYVQLILIGRLDIVPDEPDVHRAMLRNFVLPALIGERLPDPA
jgi:AcrR family transcriptional regulator